MSNFNNKLIKSIAEDHNISTKILKDILKTADEFSYTQTTQGKRINEYHGLIKFAVSQIEK